MIDEIQVDEATVGNRILITDIDSCVAVDIDDIPQLIDELERYVE
jgi:hypothetical protein